MKSSEGWHTEPLFFRPTNATEPVARFLPSSQPRFDPWMVSLASAVVAAAGMRAVGWKFGENDLT
eukprot:4730765-Alexandrium_andersonii.AAC.1